MADLLYVPMLFYVLTMCEKITTWQARLLWFGLFLLIKNELISVRASYRCYSVVLYLLDFTSLLIFLFAVQMLIKPVAPYGYDPFFWYFLAALWFFYAIWDIVMFNNTADKIYSKTQLKLWAIFMFIATAATLLCALVMGKFANDLSSTSHKVIFYLAQLVPSTFTIYAIYCWFTTVRANFTSAPAEQPTS